MKGKAKFTAAAFLALSYLLVLGLFTHNVEFCGCGASHWLPSSLRSVGSVSGGWNSWLGNSWALGASSWTAPVLASASEADSALEPGAQAPVFEEWRLREGFAIEPLARIASDFQVPLDITVTGPQKASAAGLPRLDCLEKLEEVQVVVSRIDLSEVQADAVFEMRPHVVVVTAEFPKVEFSQQPLAPLAAAPGCPGAVKIFHRRSAI